MPRVKYNDERGWIICFHKQLNSLVDPLIVHVTGSLELGSGGWICCHSKQISWLINQSKYSIGQKPIASAYGSKPGRSAMQQSNVRSKIIVGFG